MESDYGFSLLKVDVTKDFEFVHDLKREDQDQASARKTSQMTRYYIPSQAIMSVEELKKEIKSGIEMGQKIYVSHVLEVLRGREKMEYSIARIYLLCQEKMIDVAQKEANLLFYTPEFFSYETHVLKLLLMLARARHAFGAHWLAYSDYQRAMSIINDIKLRGKTKDFELEDIISAFEIFADRLFNAIGKQSYTQTLCVFGQNVKNAVPCDGSENLDKDGFKTYLELKNRRVIQMVSSEFHTLALVDHDVINTKIANPTYFSAWKTPDVYGWGSNQHGQVLGIPTLYSIDSPTVIRNFIGKDIKGIGANNLISLCWDSKGEIFIWGKKRSNRKEFERVYSSKTGIVTCKLGSNFIILLTQDNKIYYQGTIPDRHFEDMFVELKKNFVVESLEVGNDHVIVMTKDKKFYGLGSNLKGQLGVGEQTLYENEFREIHFSEFVPQKAIAFLDRTIYISTKGEIFLLGAFYDQKRRGESKRNAWFPMKLGFEGQNKVEIAQIQNSETQVVIIDKDNEAYIWDLCKGRSFKKFDFENEALFSSVSVTRDSIIFQKEIFDPKMTQIVSVDKDNKSYENINIKVQAKSASGDPVKRPCKNNRYHVLFFNNSVARIKDIQKLVYETAVLEQVPIEKRTGLHIKYNDNTQVPVLKLHVSQDEKDPSIQNIDFAFTSNGEYYMYIFLNENLLDGMPLIIKVAKGKQQLKAEEEANQQRIAARKAEAETYKKQEIAHTQKLKNDLTGWEGIQTTHITTTKRADDFFRFYMNMGKEMNSRVKSDVDLLRQIKIGGGYNEQIISDLGVIRSDHPRLIHDDLKRPLNNYGLKTFNSMSQDEKIQDVSRRRLIHSTVNHIKDGEEVPRGDINSRLKFFFNQSDMKRDNYGCRVIDKAERSYFETMSNVAMAAFRQCCKIPEETLDASKQSEGFPSPKRGAAQFSIASPQSSSRMLSRSVSHNISIEKEFAKFEKKSLTPKNRGPLTMPIIEDDTPVQTPKKAKGPTTSIQKSSTEKVLSTNFKTEPRRRIITKPPIPSRSPITPLKLDNTVDTSIRSVPRRTASTKRDTSAPSTNNKSANDITIKKQVSQKSGAQTFRKRLFSKKKKNKASSGGESENILRSITPTKVEFDSGAPPMRNNSSRPTTATENEESQQTTRKNSLTKKSRPSTANMMALKTEGDLERPITPSVAIITKSTFTATSPIHSESEEENNPTFKHLGRWRVEPLEISRLSTIKSSPKEEYYSPAERGSYQKHNRNNFVKTKKPIPQKELFKDIGKVVLELPQNSEVKGRANRNFTVKNSYAMTASKPE